MMPLSMAKEGEPVEIKKVGGKEETRKFFGESGLCRRQYSHSDHRNEW